MNKLLNNMNKDTLIGIIIGIIVTIISTIIGIIFTIYYGRKRASIIINDPACENDFGDLFRIVNTEHVDNLKVLLGKIKQDFSISIYEVQIEDESELKGGERMLKTMCSNYGLDQPKVPIKNGKKYNGQTTYAFIKNRYMWITDRNMGFLNKKLNRKVQYVDEWSTTNTKEIPNFWWPEDAPNIGIRTSVILPLKFPCFNSNFGFIDFESTEYVGIRTGVYDIKRINRLRRHFQDIAKVIALAIIKKNEHANAETENP
jgi:hypothetical protein